MINKIKHAYYWLFYRQLYRDWQNRVNDKNYDFIRTDTVDKPPYDLKMPDVISRFLMASNMFAICKLVGYEKISIVPNTDREKKKVMLKIINGKWQILGYAGYKPFEIMTFVEYAEFIRKIMLKRG
jgi:hypothetical protein